MMKYKQSDNLASGVCLSFEKEKKVLALKICIVLYLSNGK